MVWKFIKSMLLFIGNLFKKKSKYREIKKVELHSISIISGPVLNPLYVPEKKVTPHDINKKKIKKFFNKVTKYNQIIGEII